MHDIEYSILKLFRENPDKDFSTKAIVEYVFAKNIEEKASKYHDFEDPNFIRENRELRAKLHRKILYHLNKLVSDDLLRVEKIGAKGEKHFALNMEEGEEIIFKRKKRRIMIAKPQVKAMPIEGYEQQGILHKFEPETWVTRVNSILLQADRFNLDELYSKVIDIFSHVNDVVCLNNFEALIQVYKTEELERFIRKLSLETIDYAKQITLTIDLRSSKKQKKIHDFIEMFSTLKATKIIVIFEVGIKDVQKHKEFFIDVIEHFIAAKIPLYVKNNDLHEPPYMIGKAGPYTFANKDWKTYRNQLSKTNNAVVCSYCSVAIDVKRFFDAGGKIEQFRKLIANTLKTLFFANSALRARSTDYFKGMIDSSGEGNDDLFSVGKNYIRFWNYGWKQPDRDQELVIDLIASTKRHVRNFCLTQDSIYKACGMPMRFNASFSCAFNNFCKDLTSEDFKKTKLKDIKQLYSGEIRDSIETKESIFKTFDGGDRARFYRSGDATPDEISRELDLILNLFNLPLVCFDFGEITGQNLKLTSFM